MLAFWIIFFVGAILRIKGSFHWVYGGTAHNDARLILHQVKAYVNGYFDIPVIPTYPLMIYLFYAFVFICDRIFFTLGLGPWMRGAIEKSDLTLLSTFFCGIVAIGSLILVYRIAKKTYGSWGACLALLLFSFSPFHILNAHFCYADILVTFFILLVILAAVNIHENGRLRWYLGAGISWAFAVAAKPSGLLAFAPVLVAHLFHCFSSRQSKHLRIHAKFLLFLLMGGLTYFALTPYFLSDFDFFLSCWTGRASDQYPVLSFIKLIKGMIFEGGLILQTYGWNLVLLFILSLFFARPRARVCIFLSYPLLYFAVLGMNRFIDERYMDPLTPFLALVPLGFLFWAAYHLRRIRLTRAILLTTVFIVAALPSVYKSLELSWLFSEKDTRYWSGAWMKRNLPQGTEVMMIGYPLYEPEVIRDKIFEIVPYKGQSFEEARKKAQYYSSTALRIGPHRHNRKDNPIYATLSSKYQPMKRFDLKYFNFINPTITLFKLDQPQFRRDKSIFLYQPYAFGNRHEIIFCNQEEPYVNEAVGGIFSSIPYKRILVSDQPLQILGIQIYGGPFSGDVNIGLAGTRRKIHLKPFEEIVMGVTPRRSFPFFKWIYQVDVRETWGLQGGFRVITDPYQLGVAAIKSEDFKLAVQCFEQVIQSSVYPRDTWYWLGVAYENDRDYKKAASAFERAKKTGVFADLEKLLKLTDSRAFDAQFCQLFQMDAALYRYPFTVKFEAEKLHRQKGVGENVAGRRRLLRYHSAKKAHKAGFLVYGPNVFFPRGAYEASFTLRAKPTDQSRYEPIHGGDSVDTSSGTGAPAPESRGTHGRQSVELQNKNSKKAMIKLDVFANRTLVRKVIQSTDVRTTGFKDYKLHFTHQRPWEKLEFRVEVFGGDVWVDRIIIKPDLRGMLRENLKEFSFSLAKIYAKTKEYSKAIPYAKKAIQYDSKDHETLFFLGHLEFETSKVSKARKTLLKVLKKAPRHYDALKILSEISSDDQKDIFREKFKILNPTKFIPLSFEDGINFMGISLHKTQFRSGDEMEIHYFWKCRKAIRGRYAFFVHFRGADFFQQDYEPDQGGYPTQLWKVGEVVKETSKIIIPKTVKPGQYQIYIGIWNPKGGKERLSVSNTDETVSENAVHIGNIEIT